MIKKIFALILIVPTLAYADCDKHIVGFGGLNNAFDHKAFEEYAKNKNACFKYFKWQEKDLALSYIKKLNVDFELYGFSKGAETVAKLVKYNNIKPKYIITIGAYKTTDVDFTKYNIKFDNYFDYSGIGQKSPGVHIKNVSHLNMQKHVNKIF